MPADAPMSHWFHRRLVYPAVVRAIGEGTLFARLRALRQLERLAPDQLHRYQAVQLAASLRHAAAHSPFYRDRGGIPAAPRVEDAHAILADLPFVSKAELQQSLEAMRVTVDVGRVSRKITGGSTGQAVTVIKDRHATAFERAAMWLGYSWRGVTMGDPVARFWGAPFATKRRWLTGASDFAMNRIRFSAFAFDDADLERYWQRCREFRPVYLHGYVSMLEAFAGYLQRRGHDGRQIPLKSIIATSEVLTGPQRTLIEETFGAPVQIEYGCGELGPIAYECERGSLHLMSADVAVELLTEAGQPAAEGETGEVVITDLNNRAMPLLRYRLGDFAIPGAPCACGRSLPTLAKIWGRAYDFVEGPDGRRYHGEFFMYLFEDLRAAGMGVLQFQVTQTDRLALDVAVVTEQPLTEPHQDRIAALLSQRLPGMRATVRRVSRIERTASGKMRLIRNEWQPTASTA